MPEYHVDEVNGSWMNNGLNKENSFKSLFLAKLLAAAGDNIKIYSTSADNPALIGGFINSGVTLKSGNSDRAWISPSAVITDRAAPVMSVAKGELSLLESFFAKNAASLAPTTSNYLSSATSLSFDSSAGNFVYGTGSCRIASGGQMRTVHRINHRIGRLRILFKCQPGGVLRSRFDTLPYKGGTLAVPNDRRSFNWQTGLWDTAGDYDIYDDGNNSTGIPQRLDENYPDVNDDGWAEVNTLFIDKSAELTGSSNNSSSIFSYFKASSGDINIQHIIYESKPEWELADNNADRNIWMMPWGNSANVDGAGNDFRKIPALFYLQEGGDATDFTQYRNFEGEGDPANNPTTSDSIDGLITGITTSNEAVFSDNNHELSDGHRIWLSNMFEYDPFFTLNKKTWTVSDSTTNTFKLKYDDGTYFDSTGLVFTKNIAWQKVMLSEMTGSRSVANSKFYSLTLPPGKTPADYLLYAVMHKGFLQFNGDVSGSVVLGVNGICSQQGVLHDSTGINQIENIANYVSVHAGIRCLSSGNLRYRNFFSMSPRASNFTKEYSCGVLCGVDANSDEPLVSGEWSWVEWDGDDSYQPIGNGKFDIKGAVSKNALNNDIEVNCSMATGVSMKIDGFTGNGDFRDQSLSNTICDIKNAVFKSMILAGAFNRTYIIGDDVLIESSSVVEGTSVILGGWDALVNTDYVRDYDEQTFVPSKGGRLQGTGKKTTGRRHSGANGEPFSDIPDVGGIMSKHSEEHPSNR